VVVNYNPQPVTIALAPGTQLLRGSATVAPAQVLVWKCPS
jgi:hypothetical protein